MKSIFHTFTILLLFSWLGVQEIYCQTDSIVSVMMFQSSVRDLMKLPLEISSDKEIFSASKIKEKAFNAPLTSYVITQEDIQKAGASHIAEALRLVPGAVVRETSNGNYTVDLRGLDNTLPYGELANTQAKGILLMIDGRPMYNQLLGGVFWETLPIDIHDVEQIEVVQGPVSALYGSNAMNGVINIITRRVTNKKIAGNLQAGSFNSFIANSAVSYQNKNEKFAFTISNHVHQRNRTEETYFFTSKNQYVVRDSLKNPSNPAFVPSKLYPDPTLSFRKYAINTFWEYKPHSNLQMRLSAGFENDQAHKIAVTNNVVTPMANTFSETYYIDYQATWKNISTQAAMATGEQEFKTNLSPIQFQNWDMGVEYNFTRIKNLRVTPILNYKSYAFRDKNALTGFLRSESYKINTVLAGGIKLDYMLWEKLRMIANLRLEKFNDPNDIQTSYQAILTYLIHPRHLIRLTTGKSNTSSSIVNTYLDVTFKIPFNQVPGFTRLDNRLLGGGGQNLNLINQHIFEVGYRAKILQNISLDITCFYSITQDFLRITQRFYDFSTPPIGTGERKLQSIDAKLYQTGVTVSMDFKIEKLQIKPFITIQNSEIKNFSPYFDTKATNPTKNVETTFDVEHKATPRFFGGLVFDYQPIKALNINLNGYFFDKHTYYANLLGEVAKFQTEDEGGAKVKAQFILNTKISYRLSRQTTVFANVRNLFAHDYQSYYSDIIRPSYLLGFSFEM
jgi:iron complex outermembrane recepter protein